MSGREKREQRKRRREEVGSMPKWPDSRMG